MRWAFFFGMINGILLELSLTVPITNSMAFLFTVLGEWVVEKKVIGRGMVLLRCG